MEDHLRQLLIEELGRARHGFGLADTFDSEATRSSPVCGDRVTVRISGDRISWEGNGCAVSLAAASALGALSVAHVTAVAAAYLASVAPGGIPVEEHDLAAFAGIGRFPLRAGCATLAWRAASEALAVPG